MSVSGVMSGLRKRILWGAVLIAVAGHCGGAGAMSLKEAITVTLESNPSINEAIANREAREFELRQAHGLYLPEVDVEARIGPQRLDSPGTRAGTTRDDGVVPSPALNDDDAFFERSEANVVVKQLLFDGFNRRGERRHQAARVDSASFRVFEISESTALNVVRQYLEIGLRQKIVAFAAENLAYHRMMLGKLKEGTANEAISIADRQQVEERVFAAEARRIEAIEDLNSAKIRFFKLVGVPLDRHEGVPAMSGVLPRNLAEAIGFARQNNPNVQVAKADLDAAYGLRTKARSEFLPEISLEATARTGDDLEAVRGAERELKAELVARWNIFRGRIDSNKVQEQVRRIDEERYGLHKAHRDVEEAVRLSWERNLQQRRRLSRLQDQAGSISRLISSYTEQFKVGERSLLDLLDTQNTRFNNQVAVETARTSVILSEYRILASTGMLLRSLRIEPPSKSEAYARDQERVPETPAGETMKRYAPKRSGWEPVTK